MRFSCLFSVVCLLGLSMLSAAPVQAQGACADCTERYVDLAESRGLQTEIDILLPTDELILDRSKRKPDTPGEEGEPGSDNELSPVGQTGVLLISGLILAALALVLYQNSAGGLVSFGSNPKDASKPAPKRGGSGGRRGEDDGLPKSEAAFLAEIEAMSDRRKALHLLSERLLSRAADKAGIRLGRSWTSRESIRALPRSWVHLADLRHLNRHAERAWFGGRAVDDSVFEDCLGRARVMMRGGAA